MDYKAIYESKLTTADEAVKLIQDGDTVDIYDFQFDYQR